MRIAKTRGTQKILEYEKKKDAKQGGGRNKSSDGLMYPKGGSGSAASFRTDYLCVAWHRNS